LSFAGALLAPREAHAGDPYLTWSTVDTPHFYVHYHSGLEWHAERVARIAEDVHRELVPETGWAPKQRTHIVLTDDTDSANGYARVIPYNEVHLYVTAPEDMSPLGDYDDWLTLLVTHEYTHVLHIDNKHGAAAALNALLGKTYAPNQVQPKWITEGWATFLESKYTSGGRLRSTQFDMYVRADVLENHVPTLGQLSAAPIRWPGGTLWYLYGGRFLGWISETYGEDALARMSTEYGSNLIPWGVNRAIRRATGRTYPELWAGFRRHVEARYADQVAAVEARGRREGVRVTRRGQGAGGPLFVPPCARRFEEGYELLYFSSDGHSPDGLYRLAVTADGRVLAPPKLEIRTTGTQATFDGECGLITENRMPSERRYSFDDLIRIPRGMRSPSGREGFRERLTRGRRARTPDVSPDGRQIAYVTNRAGTTTLRIAELSATSELSNERALVPSVAGEQAYSPRFSPDGRWVAYGVWRRGGFRDLALVEVSTGKLQRLTDDRALDHQPAWAPDGKTLYFTSDRTGIANIYALDLAKRELRQVTNVVNGAYMPAVSADGKLLAYVGYTSRGFDLFVMPLDPARDLPALPYTDDRPSVRDRASGPAQASRDYRPIESLRPRSYTVQLARGTFGQAATLATSGSDAAGLHGFGFTAVLETGFGPSSLVASYSYGGLPFGYRASVYRRAAPRRSYRIGDRTPRYVETGTGVSSSVSIPLGEAFQSQAVSLGYNVLEYSSDLPRETDFEPYARVTVLPNDGFFASLSAGYSYSNAQSFTHSVGPERGVTVNANAELSAPELGSEASLTAFTGRFRGYLPNPLLRHHVLAVALSGGTSVGSYARRGLFYTGGFSGGDLVENVRTMVYESSFVLRGYTPGQFVGSQYTLLNAEYRFPLADPELGFGTLPFYWRGAALAFFADYGGAYNRMDIDHPEESLQLGLGGELRLDLVLGFAFPFDLRLGYARGTDSDAIDGGQTYAVFSSAF
jgi:hypothetical protein